ncbi:MAG TPA: hypothetical protein VG225_02670 [Terracidiphilus sp.]|jgi:hypothetical protein|nr:hypothetical protein [Terracidiphilus sp.]
MPLTVKDAIQAARAHLAELMPDLAKPEDIRLEEIERAGDHDWAITLSIPGGTSLTGFSANPFGLNRIAKVVVVDGTNGTFVALRQRAA